MVTTTGRTIMDGLAGDDILEDHNAEAGLIGGAGNDRLISRNGRDALWGGNIFAVTACTDDDDGGETDEIGNACEDYTPEECGSYDDDDFIASTLCCYCGGGSPGDEVVITTTGTFMGAPIP